MKKSVIGTGATFSGKIGPVGTIEIHGNVTSDIISDKLVIGKAGQLNGNAHSALSVIEGSFSGSLKSKSVWVMASSRLSGEIEYHALQMDRGAAIDCRIKHNWDTPSEQDGQDGTGQLPFFKDKSTV